MHYHHLFWKELHTALVEDTWSIVQRMASPGHIIPNNMWNQSTPTMEALIICKANKDHTIKVWKL